VIERDGEVICAAGRYRGECTNNVAEYEALIWALENARALGVGEVSVRADSELLVKQVTGAYRVKNEGLKPLFRRLMTLLRGFEAYDIAHVRREDNAAADALANAAMDERATVGEPACAPGASGANASLF